MINGQNLDERNMDWIEILDSLQTIMLKFILMLPNIVKNNINNIFLSAISFKEFSISSFFIKIN